MLDWDTERGGKRVLTEDVTNKVDMLYVCEYVYMRERETLTKIVYSQLHTEGFANQQNRTVFPQLPQFSPSFPA